MLLGNQPLGDVELGSFSIPATTPVVIIVVTPTPAEIAVFGNSVSATGCSLYPRAIRPVAYYNYSNFRPSDD